MKDNHYWREIGLLATSAIGVAFYMGVASMFTHIEWTFWYPILTGIGFLVLSVVMRRIG